MCIKKEDPLKMPVQNGMVKKKQPKIVIKTTTNPAPSSGNKKRLISSNQLGRLAADSLITSPPLVKSEPQEVKEADSKVRAGTRAFISIMIHAKSCRFVNIKKIDISQKFSNWNYKHVNIISRILT